MSAITKIQWTDRTWNCVRGCSLVSEGCRSCYAMKQAHRFSGEGKPYNGLTKLTSAGPQWTGVVRTVDDALLGPLSWRKPQRVFVNSMSDLFHEDVPDAFIDRVFAVMASSRHTFQVLTKRPERMRAYMQRVAAGAPAAGARYESDMRAHFERYKMEFKEGYSLPEPPTPELRFLYDSAARQENRPTSPDGTTLRVGFSGGEYHWRPWPLSNVWLGVSVENQDALKRIDMLKDVPAAVRFVSFEPLLEHLGALLLDGIQWAIVGGESGPHARPCALEWLESIVEQCHEQGVAPFVKQLGAFVVSEQRTVPVDMMPGQPAAYAKFRAPNGDVWAWRAGLTDKKGGDIEEFPERLRHREFPTGAPA